MCSASEEIKGQFNSYLVVLFILWIFCLVFRLSFLIGSSFPLHDGGFFYTLINDLRNNHYLLPFYTSFNQDSIPYTYPPLAFYMTGLLSDLLKVDTLQLLKYLPAIISSFCIPAFWLLARTVFPSEKKALFATFCYAFLPFSNIWVISGGGITRATGDVFSLLALYFLIRALKENSTWTIWLVPIFSGLTVLSHPEAAFFLVYSFVIVFFFYGRGYSRKKTLCDLLIVGLGTLLISSPWWAINIIRHGTAIFQPFLDSGSSRLSSLLSLFLLNFTSETSLAVLCVLGIVGVIIFCIKKDYFLLVWLIAPFVLQPRAADQRVIIPLALAAGESGGLLIEFFFEKKVLPRNFALIISGFFFFLVLISTMSAIKYIDNPIDPQLISAIEWLKSQDQKENVLVVQPKSWALDSTTEWVATLSGHHTSVEVQGYEWIPGFSERILQHAEVTKCLGEGVNCVVQWCTKTDSFWVFIPTDNLSNDAFSFSQGLINQLLADKRFSEPFSNSGAVVFHYSG